MAYGEKYFLTYCDSYGNDFRVSILQRDFVGEAIELEGQPNPFLLTYENSDDFKFKPIVPSRAEVNLTFGTGNGVDFEEFWTSDEKSFKVEHYKNSTLDWVGFVVPNGFDYEFRGGLYYASIIAADGLSTLEAFLFIDPNTNKPYGLSDLNYNDGFQFPFILIATEILRKLELDLDTWSLVDVYEKSMIDRTSDSRNSDPLAVSYVNVKTYINKTDRNDIPYFEAKEEAWNCDKVLENLLYIWGCKIYQEGGVWRIKRVTIDSKYGFTFPKVVDGNYWYKATYTDDPYTDGGAVFSPFRAVYSQNKDLYSVDSDLTVGSQVENVLGSGIASDGYYKLTAVDDIVFVSGNQITNIYTYTHPTYYWHKYNTLAGYIGREEINESVIIPCGNNDTFLLGNDHVMRMDEVYKQFRVNYGYTFVREGDSPVNIIQNGSFSKSYDQNSKLASPPNWQRASFPGKWMPRLHVNTLSSFDSIASGGYTHALEYGTQYPGVSGDKLDHNGRTSSWLQSDRYVMDQVESMTFQASARYKYRLSDGKTIYPILQGVFFADNGDVYNLVVRDLDDKSGYGLTWVKIEAIGQDNQGGALFGLSWYFQLEARKADNYILEQIADTKWYIFNFKVDAPPATGTIRIDIHGLACNADNGDSFKVKGLRLDQTDSILKGLTDGWSDLNGNRPHLQITGINLGYIPQPDEEIPSSDYIYANANVNYTDQRDPIEVFNGDTVSNEVVSGITVPTNLTGQKNKWDTANNDFGKSDIGLIQAKAIMSQYNRPFRLLEGSLKSDNIGYGTRFELEALPNIQFILLRATFNSIRGYLEDATLAEISSAAIAKGGIINGESLDPVWTPTGNVRCIKDGSNENTGEIEIEEIDSNSNSETFGAFRWVEGGEDLIACPIGEPSKYYWGTDDAGYDLENFKDYTIQFDGNGVVQVNFDNEGGKYIYFLHLASLGVVNRVANNFQYNIISSFQYLADVTIDGYLYRVLRQDFVTSEFTGFTLTFDFN